MSPIVLKGIGKFWNGVRHYFLTIVWNRLAAVAAITWHRPFKGFLCKMLQLNYLYILERLLLIVLKQLRCVLHGKISRKYLYFMICFKDDHWTWFDLVLWAVGHVDETLEEPALSNGSVHRPQNHPVIPHLDNGSYWFNQSPDWLVIVFNSRTFFYCISSKNILSPQLKFPLWLWKRYHFTIVSSLH